jgi:hypothetical protein
MRAGIRRRPCQPARRRQELHEPPHHRPTERYETQPVSIDTSHTSRRFTVGGFRR